MPKKTLILPLLFFILSSFSLPTYLDYGKIKKGACENTNDIHWNIGILAFNGSPELSTLFSYLKHVYKIEVAIETGTFQGNTTVLLSHIFDEVHTIEIVDDVYQRAKEKLSPFANIYCHLGSSDEVLKEILPAMCDKPALFYLDAHWHNHWPLRNELIEISKTHHDNCIIVIDDFQVPSRKDIPFDQYGENACCYSYIKDQLNKVYSDYTIHYIIPEDPRCCRAKFLAIPTSFQK